MKSAIQHSVDLEIEIRPIEVFRMMGCAGRRFPAQRYRALLDKLVTETEPMIRPRGVYIVRDVRNMADTELSLDAGPAFHGPVAGFLQPAQRIAVYVVTIGPELEALSRRRMSDADTLEGFMLDAIGSAAVDATCDALIEHLRREELGAHEALTPPFSPGYCGLSVREQKTLFAYLDTTDIGVTLTESCFMKPIKSISGLIGIGQRAKVIARGSPCQWCDLHECKMRRA